jgi:hypothetical protein
MRLSGPERCQMLEMAGVLSHLQSLTVRSASGDVGPSSPTLRDIEVQFPRLVALSVDLTRQNSSHAWSMNRLEVLEVCLLDLDASPQSTWNLPALHSFAAVITGSFATFDELKSFFDVHGRSIRSLAVSAISHNPIVIPETWWQSLPHLVTLHLDYGILLPPSGPPLSLRHVHLHSSCPTSALKAAFPDWFQPRRFNGRLTVHITRQWSSVLLLDRADDNSPRPPLPGEDALDDYEDSLFSWCLGLESFGIRLEEPDGLSCGEVLSQRTVRDFWRARKEWATGTLRTVLDKHSVFRD